MHNEVIGHLIFVEDNINGDVYCDMLQEYVFPLLVDIEVEKGHIVFQKNGALSHFSLWVGKHFILDLAIGRLKEQG